MSLLSLFVAEIEIELLEFPRIYYRVVRSGIQEMIATVTKSAGSAEQALLLPISAIFDFAEL